MDLKIALISELHVQMKNSIIILKEMIYMFKTTSRIGNYLYVDCQRRKLRIPHYKLIKNLTRTNIFKFEEFEDFELLAEEGIGNTGKFCTMMEVKVKFEGRVSYIKLIKKPTKITSNKYKKAFENAQQIVSTLQFIKIAKESYCY